MSTPGDKAKGGTVQGEGDYEAGRRFDKAEQQFVKAGKDKQSAGKAAPHNPAEAAEMNDAEAAGKSRSKGEAPGDLKPRTPKPRKAP